MKVKPSDLTGAALNWAVARAKGNSGNFFIYSPSTDWEQGGPIIEQEEIFLAKSTLGGWTASIYTHDDRVRCTLQDGETPLIAAMRCYVASKLGEEVDVPDDLVWDELIYDKGDEE